MSKGGRAAVIAALASVPVLPLGWFIGLQAQPAWIPAAYLGYLLVVIAIPGTLFWRKLTGGTGWFAVDAVLGTTFGLACEALIYPLGRWLDIPLLALVMPALALGHGDGAAAAEGGRPADAVVGGRRGDGRRSAWCRPGSSGSVRG